MLVIHDEIDLPFGDIRVRLGGGLAGHNGLKSLKRELGGADFQRVRIGVGRPDTTDPEIVSAHVLGQVAPERRRGARARRARARRGRARRARRRVAGAGRGAAAAGALARGTAAAGGRFVARSRPARAGRRTALVYGGH